MPNKKQPLKFKKKSIALIIGGTLLTGVILAFGAISIMQSSIAANAADEYKQAVLQHARDIRRGPQESDRVNELENKVKLKDVWLGSLTSSRYRDAEALEQRYASLLDETSMFFKEAESLYALPDVYDYVYEVQIKPVPSRAEGADTVAMDLGQRAVAYATYAEMLEDLYVKPELDEQKAAALAAMRSTSENYKKMSEAFKTNDNPDSIVAPLDEKNIENTNVLREFFPLMRAYVDELLARLPDEVTKVNERYETFITSLR